MHDPEPASAPRRATAFGLDLELGFDAVGLRARESAALARRPVRVELAEAAALDAEWEPSRATVLDVEDLGTGTPQRAIAHAPGPGYRLHARCFGAALVDEDAARIRFAPEPVPPAQWQRFLLGRILPFTALLHGLETMHAGAVCLDGRAVAIAGPSGTGKSSVATALAASGASWLTDDVLALEPDARGALAHPGPGVVALRPDAAAALGRTIGLPGHVLDRRDKVLVELPPPSGPVPLGAVYFLDRSATEATIEPLADAAPRLLAATFAPALLGPGYMVRQLEVLAALAHHVGCFRLAVPSGEDGSATAVRLRAHARRDIGRER